MAPKTCALLVVAFCILVSGCTGEPPEETTTREDCSPGETPIDIEHDPANATAFIDGIHVSGSEVPENATILQYSDVKDHKLLRQVVRASIQRGDIAVKLNQSMVAEYEEAVADLPRHDGDEPGYYVDCDGDTVRFFLAVYE